MYIQESKIDILKTFSYYVCCLMIPCLIFLSPGIQISYGKGSHQVVKANNNEQLVTFDSVWSSPYRVDPAHPLHFVNGEGRHLFVLTKVAFGYFACQDPEKVLEKAKLEGVNVMRVVLEGLPCHKALQSDLWPWAGSRSQPVWNAMNESYWDKIENRIQLAGNKGIGFNIVLYHDLFPNSGDVESQLPYWETAIKRLSKYANILTWEITNEYTANEAFHDAAARFFQSNDPYRRPVISSGSSRDYPAWSDKSWMDMTVVHTKPDTEQPTDLDQWYKSVLYILRKYDKPIYNNQSGKVEKYSGNDPSHIRKKQWLWSMAGGYWSWDSEEGCEKINSPYYYGSGWQYLKPMQEFFSALPFWEFSPGFTKNTIGDGIVHVILQDGKLDHIVSYLCTQQSGQYVRNLRTSFMLNKGHYIISYIRPSDLKEHSSIEIISSNPNDVLEFQLPDFQNDLLILATRISNDIP